MNITETIAAEGIALDLQEARDILAGKSTQRPEYRHLYALQASGQFWMAAAKEANELIATLEVVYDQRAAAFDEFADMICAGAIQ